MSVPLLVLASLVWLFTLVSPPQAQPVRVESGDQTGQGYLFRDGGTCWLVTAGHLIDDWGGFDVIAPGTPPARGEGNAVRPFWAGLDLAVGAVRGAAAGGACRATFADLDRPWTAATPRARLRLPHVGPGGALDGAAMAILDIPDHKTFLAEFTDGAPAFTGRSGAMLLADGRPVGMVVTRPTEDSAGRAVANAHGLIRIEEIAMNLRRFLDARGIALVRDGGPRQEATAAGFEVVVQSTDLEPASVETSPGNVLANGAPFLFHGTGRIVLAVADGSEQVLSRVEILSDGAETRPKAIAVFTDRRAEGPPGWTPFWDGRMDPAGRADTGFRRATPMRRVIVTISSAWGGDPQRIDRIVLY